MGASRIKSIAGVCIFCLATGGGHLFGLDRGVLQILGLSAGTRGVAFAEARSLDWSDLIPNDEKNSAPRLRDGSLPRGVVQHGEITGSAQRGASQSPGPPSQDNTNLPAIAQALGGYSSLEAAPRRYADTLGGFGSLRALQPRGAATRPDLDGQIVRMAGFVTPLAFQGTKITEFLLVPYVGACIHVPPPPANQIVLVSGVDYDLDGGLLYPVRVTGMMRATPVETDVANVGYKLDQATVERYE